MKKAYKTLLLYLKMEELLNKNTNRRNLIRVNIVTQWTFTDLITSKVQYSVII